VQAGHSSDEDEDAGIDVGSVRRSHHGAYSDWDADAKSDAGADADALEYDDYDSDSVAETEADREQDPDTSPISPVELERGRRLLGRPRRDTTTWHEEDRDLDLDSGGAEPPKVCLVFMPFPFHLHCVFIISAPL
jgi:hypothetical protein